MPLIKIERVRFATDGSMATITRTSTSEFRAALIELLQTIAAGIIAGDATVVAAAEAAVDAALENADVARRSDPAYPWMTMGDPFIHWRDKNGYATFLARRRTRQVASSPGPSRNSASICPVAMVASVGAGRRHLLRGRSSAPAIPSRRMTTGYPSSPRIRSFRPSILARRVSPRQRSHSGWALCLWT
jgi:hypothetical protein